MQTNNIGEILSDQGHLDEAERLFRETELICDAAGQRLMATVARANLGRAAARAGRLDEADSLLSEALEAFRDMKASSFALEAEVRLAEVAVLRGKRPEEALERTRAALDHAEEAAEMAALHASALRLRAAARLQLGDSAGAREDLAESVETARGAGALYELALALDVRAAADGDTADAAESAALLERLGVERVARPPLTSSTA
jgi:tetratricopeptide (TPR) repeat protein